MILGYIEFFRFVFLFELGKVFLRRFRIIKDLVKYFVGSRGLLNGGCYFWGGNILRVVVVYGSDKFVEAVRRFG